MGRPGSKWFYGYKDADGRQVIVFVPQWKVLSEVLAPHWRFYRWGVLNFSTWKSLERRGWAEFRKIGGGRELKGTTVLMGRLTPEGRMLRDRIHEWLAKRLEKKLRPQRR